MSPLGENRVETVGEEGHKVQHINVYNLTPTHTSDPIQFPSVHQQSPLKELFYSTLLFPYQQLTAPKPK